MLTSAMVTMLPRATCCQGLGEGMDDGAAGRTPDERPGASADNHAPQMRKTAPAMTHPGAATSRVPVPATVTATTGRRWRGICRLKRTASTKLSSLLWLR
ncbi:hypothetical protein [Roseiflexus sp. RS-1]|uniref:hypothetical protein n=1 Tax=Roseiflexus sp. (strain RS-1) TaxID=357808 RepID=UPI001E3911A9|nr:hypothetical protein [Roseiflexus sp. RS-1]